jgi:replication factor C small subunit
MSVELWAEKYRPRTLDDYVWRDTAQRQKAEEWIAAGALPHVIFSGVSGTGKTSLAYLLLNQMGVPQFDILSLNASRERKIDDLQDKIISFVSTWAMGPSGIKYIFLDEADALSPLAQKLLRGEMERYQDVCRFILTANYIQKIAPEIQGRCQGFHFQALDTEQFLIRVVGILEQERVDYTDEVLGTIAERTYPDLRKCIGVLQQSTVGGKLLLPKADDGGTSLDYLTEVVSLFQAGKTLAARKLLVASAVPEEYPDIFRYFYRNLDLWGDTDEQKDQALLIIRNGLLHHAVIADPEINLSATLVELAAISR